MRECNISSDVYELKYKGQLINVLWNRQDYNLSDEYDDDDLVDRIEFDYKDVEVIEFFKSKNCEWYNVAIKVCNIIDKLGEEGYNQYQQYRDFMEEVQRKYVVSGDTIYKPKYHKIEADSEHILHIMNIKMTDGKIIDGSSNSWYDEQKLDYSKKDITHFDRTLNNLQNNLLTYIKETNVKTNDEYIENDKTLKYREILKWCKDNNVGEFYYEL